MATDFAEIGEAIRVMAPTPLLPRQTELPQSDRSTEPNPHVTAATPLGGHKVVEAHISIAARPPSGESQNSHAPHTSAALVGNLSIECRRYDDLRRAHQRLLLQAMAMCRYACDGDKAAGAKLYAKILKEPGHPLSIWLIPYFEAMKPLESAISEQEKVVSKLARQLPIWPWAKAISGVSARFLGMIVGDCGAPVGEFKSVAAVWKRMGLAVIDGVRQRRIAGEAALAHGYVARRRSLMWNVGEKIIMAQVRKDPANENLRVGIGEYGQLYIDRKAYELTKTDKPIIAHNRAKRYMEKRLLREMWKAWRAA